jgi:hypothetical protein
MRIPASEVNKLGPDKEQALNQTRIGGGGIIQLTIEILRQLGVGVPKLRRFLGHHLELVRDLGKLATRHH